MIRHVLLLRWTAEATTAQREAALRGFHELSDSVPQIRSLAARPDAGLAEGNADLLVTMDFADADAWRAYQEHPAHRALIETVLRPILARRDAVQVALP
ncbi:Dabb family protein [Nocardiopsis quinghaiensis]|uniref:Dabb family protein n=1 Tax=Nocardiopsis quinghaiensis TaxID=464995 RepID=UPI001681B67D|nr:Dabb family protein [Nocardiopsis quinghaiensis]